MDPFKGKKVGNDYGSRRKVLSESPQQIARTASQRRTSSRDAEISSALHNSATYKKGRISGTGAPYKRSLQHHVEAGTAPTQSASIAPPSTKAILSFLDRVISDDRVSSQASIFQTVKEASKKQVG